MADSNPVGGWELAELVVPAEQADIAADLMWSHGAGAVEESSVDPGLVVVRANVDRSCEGSLSDFARRHDGILRWVTVPAAVADTWRAHATATLVHDDVWLVPAWTPVPRGRAILVEPFDTFGLGNHPSTVLALRLALHHCASEGRVLDVGCGSGVLAVAMAVLTRCHCDATDLSAQAQRAVTHNSRMNGVEHRVRWVDHGVDPEPRAYVTVLANILAPVLRELAPQLIEAASVGGRIVLSGMRTEQVDGVIAEYTECALVARVENEGWAAVVLERVSV